MKSAPIALITEPILLKAPQGSVHEKQSLKSRKNQKCCRISHGRSPSFSVGKKSLTASPLRKISKKKTCRMETTIAWGKWGLSLPKFRVNTIGTQGRAQKRCKANSWSRKRQVRNSWLQIQNIIALCSNRWNKQKWVLFQSFSSMSSHKCERVSHSTQLKFVSTYWKVGSVLPNTIIVSKRALTAFSNSRD